MSMEIITRHIDELKDKSNYLNVNIGNKIKDGKDTGQKAIIIYVAKKLPCAELAAQECIPTEIEGIPTDVVELNPDGWVAGRTPISEMHPIDQMKMLGAKRNPKAMGEQNRTITVSTPLNYDWITWMSAIQNQKNCGSCVAFGNIAIFEAAYRIAENNPGDKIKFSEALPFFCSGGSCENGSDCPQFLNYLRDYGTTLEQYYPYVDKDQKCQSGVLPGWQNFIYKIASWEHITDLAIIRQYLSTGPLTACMDVHQSFFNYKSGVYASQGAKDPVVGGHCIGNIGVNDGLGAYHGRNSWDTSWGEQGYFWIKFGDSGFDSEAWKLVPILNPVPVPPVPVKKKCHFSTILGERRAVLRPA